MKKIYLTLFSVLFGASVSIQQSSSGAYNQGNNLFNVDIGLGENLALVRKMALNILKSEKSSKRSIKGKLLKAAWHNDYPVKLLTTHDF